jgi:sulfatase maturation enzyme AslB (radical SAM superfamily)
MNSINNFYVGENSQKPTYEGTGVNVIYFTNRCNLACTYCYEDLAKRPKQILSKKQIEESVDTILAREPKDRQTLFVLFGGEVTLEWENALHCMNYAYSKKTNVHFNISTNGIKFLDDEFRNNYKKLFFAKNGICSLDISFDGIGNKERIDHSGKDSTIKMLELFRKLNESKIKFRLRYTIQKLNVNDCYEDIKRIAKFISPDRIITSVDWKNLSESEINNLNLAKDKLRFDWQNGDITIPVCELFCDICDGCGERKDLKTYFTDEGNVTTYKNYENAGTFNDFKQKEKK